MKNRNVESVVSSIMFSLYPVLTIPIILKGMAKGKFFAFILFAFFLSFLAYLYPPTGDLYRYALDYYTYKGVDFTDFIMLASLKMDFFFPFILWTLGQFNVPCDFSRLIYVFISSVLIFYIFCDSTKEVRQRDSRLYKLLLIFVLLIVDYISFAYRFSFSAVLFSFGVYSIFITKRFFKGFFFLLIACMNHFAFIPILIIVVFVKFTKYQGNRLFSSILFCFILFFPFNMASDILYFIPVGGEVLSHLQVYTEGHMVSDFLNEHSAKYLIGRYINESRTWLLMLFYLISFKKTHLSGIITIYLVFLSLVSFSSFMKWRYESALFYILFLYLLYVLQINQSLFKKRIILFFVVGFICFFSSFWTRRREISISNEYKLLFPTYSILSNEYDEKWMNQNVMSDGFPLNKID